MTTQIGWLNGKWGDKNQLLIPLANRGLILGNGIFETILIYKGKPQLLKQHLSRWNKSADLLRLRCPPKELFIKSLIMEAIEKTSFPNQNGFIRVNWSKKNFTKNDINQQKNDDSDYLFWLELNSNKPYFDEISTMISKTEKRNADSKISNCKSFSYAQSIQARTEAQIAGYDDALLLSTNGNMCCGTTANLIIKRENEYLTPCIKTGCLPGIMRQQALDLGIIKESNIKEKPLPGDQWFLINSLSCQPIQKVNNHLLEPYKNPKQFWLNLLE